MSFIALFLALVLSEFVTPIFSYYTGKELSLLRWENILFIIGLITITLVVGIFAGSYPALFLSAFRPLTMLKKEYQAVKKGVAIRKGLVILQFVITICFIIATLTAKNQISYMKTQELGFNSTHILVLSPAENSPTINEFESFRNDILQNPNVLNISFSNNVPGRMYGQDIWKEYGRKDRNIVPLYEIETDYDFLDVYGLNLIAGRNLSKEMVTDAKVNITNIIAATGGLMPTTKEESGDEKKPEEIAVILNEEAVRRLGLGTPEEALGKILVRDPVAVDFTGRVIGVVRDFHFESLQTRIEPLVLYIYDKSAQNSLAASVKISGIDISGTINSIQKLWETHFEETPFAYDFIDENFAKLYEQEEKILEIFGYVSLFIIFIACLGLFGLILYVVEQKTKEIGIRKVLGATVTNILALLSKDFVKLVLIAFLIACPIAYLAMTHWLQNFAYRTNLGIWIFLTAGVLTLVIVLITVCLQALRSALANPVVSLRYE